MNEKLKEFSGIAKLFAKDYVENCRFHGYYMDEDEYQQQFENKFAELIIRKCAKVAFDDWCEGTNEESSRKAILKHFGVENEL